MASLPQSQISFRLEACNSSNKNTTNSTRPCIARLCNNKTHFINLVAKPTLLPNLKRPLKVEKWKVRSNDDGSGSVAPEFLPESPSPVHLVHEFYEAFNKKDTATLKQLLSPNCVYQDLLFYTAYEGQEVSSFIFYFVSFQRSNDETHTYYMRRKILQGWTNLSMFPQLFTIEVEDGFIIWLLLYFSS